MEDAHLLDANSMPRLGTLRMTPKLLALRQSSTVVGAQPMEACMAPLPCRVARSSTAASTVFREAWREALRLAFFAGRATGSAVWECRLLRPSPFACSHKISRHHVHLPMSKRLCCSSQL